MKWSLILSTLTVGGWQGIRRGDLTTTPLPVEKRRKAQEVTTKGIVKAGNLHWPDLIQSNPNCY